MAENVPKAPVEDQSKNQPEVPQSPQANPPGVQPEVQLVVQPEPLVLAGSNRRKNERLRQFFAFLWPALSAPASEDGETRRMGWTFYLSWTAVFGMFLGIGYWLTLYKPPLTPEAQFEIEARTQLEEPDKKSEDPITERPDFLAEVGRYYLVVTALQARAPGAHQAQDIQIAPHARHFSRVAFELAFECDSASTCTKIEGYRHQVRDLVVGVLDRSPAEDWLTREGKNKLKDHLQLRLNQWLTTGKVRQVYFLNVTLEPK